MSQEQQPFDLRHLKLFSRETSPHSCSAAGAKSWLRLCESYRVNLGGET